tara:strand:+ start:2478 stop:4139 length:1662 start_codon:yes stop_codon:yes gene_type:complete
MLNSDIKSEDDYNVHLNFLITLFLRANTHSDQNSVNAIRHAILTHKNDGSIIFKTLIDFYKIQIEKQIKKRRFYTTFGFTAFAVPFSVISLLSTLNVITLGAATIPLLISGAFAGFVYFVSEGREKRNITAIAHSLEHILEEYINYIRQECICKENFLDISKEKSTQLNALFKKYDKGVSNLNELQKKDNSSGVIRTITTIFSAIAMVPRIVSTAIKSKGKGSLAFFKKFLGISSTVSEGADPIAQVLSCSTSASIPFMPSFTYFLSRLSNKMRHAGFEYQLSFIEEVHQVLGNDVINNIAEKIYQPNDKKVRGVIDGDKELHKFKLGRVLNIFSWFSNLVRRSMAHHHLYKTEDLTEEPVNLKQRIVNKICENDFIPKKYHGVGIECKLEICNNKIIGFKVVKILDNSIASCIKDDVENKILYLKKDIEFSENSTNNDGKINNPDLKQVINNIRNLSLKNIRDDQIKKTLERSIKEYKEAFYQNELGSLATNSQETSKMQGLTRECARGSVPPNHETNFSIRRAAVTNERPSTGFMPGILKSAFPRATRGLQ